MILYKPEIKRRLASPGLEIDPTPSDSRIGPVSINLRLGRKFTRFVAGGLPDHIPYIRVRPSLFDSEDLWAHEEEANTFEIEPKGFVLAQTLERVVMPNDLMGLVEGRSSWARVGLSVHLTAPKIDPGFDGTITLEIANMGPVTVQIVAEEDEPAQLILMQVTPPLDDVDLYGAAETDIFQYQSDPIPRDGR